jgi:hypothetical protein
VLALIQLCPRSFQLLLHALHLAPAFCSSTRRCAAAPERHSASTAVLRGCLQQDVCTSGKCSWEANSPTATTDVAERSFNIENSTLPAVDILGLGWRSTSYPAGSQGSSNTLDCCLTPARIQLACMLSVATHLLAELPAQCAPFCQSIAPHQTPLIHLAHKWGR